MTSSKYKLHEHLKQIAEETQKIVQQGFYLNSKQELVKLDSKRIATNSYFLTSDIFDLSLSLQHDKFETKISITNESTTTAAYRLYDEQKDVGVLNFASYKVPGGYWLGGAEAQEEHLTKCSDLVLCLNNCPEFYKQHMDQNHLGMALDIAIQSPQVSFFRNPDYSLKDSVTPLFVLTVAAPDLRNYFIDDQLNSELLSTIPKFLGLTYEQILENRLRFILNCFLGSSVIVLGAFGCGVFRNDPKLVASIFHRLLNTEFKNQFKEVVFAVLDSGVQGKINLEVFQKEFNDVSIV